MPMASVCQPIRWRIYLVDDTEQHQEFGKLTLVIRHEDTLRESWVHKVQPVLDALHNSQSRHERAEFETPDVSAKVP